jgi:hypothetical protein
VGAGATVAPPLPTIRRAAVKPHWSNIWNDIEKKIPTAMGNVTGSVGAFPDLAAKKGRTGVLRRPPAQGGERGPETIDSCIASAPRSRSRSTPRWRHRARGSIARSNDFKIEGI